MEGFILSQDEYKQFILFTLEKMPINKFAYGKEKFIEELSKISDFKIFTYIHKILQDPDSKIKDASADDYYYIGMVYTLFFNIPEKELLYYSLSVDMGNMKGIGKLTEIYKNNNNVEMEEKYRMLNFNKKLLENNETVYDISELIHFYERNGKRQKVKEYTSIKTEKELSEYESISNNDLLSIERHLKEDPTILLKIVTTKERYDVFDRYKIYFPCNSHKNLQYYAQENRIINIEICDLLTFLDAYAEEEMLNTISSIKPEDINKHPKFIQMIYKLLHSNFDSMKLHFEYSMKGKGFEDAKTDFYKYASGSTPE